MSVAGGASAATVVFSLCVIEFHLKLIPPLFILRPLNITIHCACRRHMGMKFGSAD